MESAMRTVHEAEVAEAESVAEAGTESVTEAGA